MSAHDSYGHQLEMHAGDSDLQKGAVEGLPGDQGNLNAEGALDDEGMPCDEVAIAQDRLGANVDQTQG